MHLYIFGGEGGVKSFLINNSSLSIYSYLSDFVCVCVCWSNVECFKLLLILN